MRKVGFLIAGWILVTTALQGSELEVLSNVNLDLGGKKGSKTSCKESDLCCDEQWYLLPQDMMGFKTYGWAEAGIIWNTSNPGSKFNGPYNAVDRSNEAMFNQLYLVTERGLPCCGVGVGARLDLLYGEDYLLAESIGLEKRQNGAGRWNNEFYGLAIPQAYVSFGNESLSMQLGHFYSVVGYEGVMAPDNFFYSRSYSYQFAGPFTHWGGQVNWKPSEAWTVQMGLHNGWDALDKNSDDVGFIGKVRYDFCSGAWGSFALTTGKDFSNPATRAGVNNDFTNRTRYSLLLGAPLGCRFEYVFHHWLGTQQDGGLNSTDANWYGIDQYVYYTINDCWKAGTRFEWFRDEDGTRVGLNRPSNPNVGPFIGDVYSFALGLNWTPNNNVVIRPELRVDWFDGAGAQPFDDGAADDQFTLGFDAILRF